MTINILLCDTFPGLLPHYIPSYVWMFTTLFDAARPGISYKVHRAMDGQLPRQLRADEMYLITGCNQSVYDDTVWIKSLLAWIAEAHEARVKLVGICFGHQAIAQALGGKVERASQGWGVGIRQSALLHETAWKHFPDRRMSLLYNHHDQVTRLPTGATVLAQSDFCPIDSFSIGQHILTFQGHPEYVPEYEAHLIQHFADDEPIGVKQAALYSMAHTAHQGALVARWIAEWAEEPA